MINPYDRPGIVSLLRNAAEYVRYGSRPFKDMKLGDGNDPMTIHQNLSILADHLEQED